MNWRTIIAGGASIAGDLIGGHQNRQHQDHWNRQNIKLQKEFAQKGI